jgi:hypothetical protein
MTKFAYKYSEVLGNPAGEPMQLDGVTVTLHMDREAEGGWELIDASTCVGTWSGTNRDGQNVDKPGTVLCSLFWRKVMD